jgi:hypothetical protein
VPPPRWRPTLEDYVDVAAFLLSAPPEAVRSLPRLRSAESAIHAPFASFGGEEAYPELLDQAAVLIAHLAQNHPLPDGNKRAAFLLTARSSTPTTGRGQQKTRNSMRPWSNASLPAKRLTTRSSRGSSRAPAIEGATARGVAAERATAWPGRVSACCLMPDG